MNKSGTIAQDTEVFHSVVHFSGRVQGVGFRYLTLQIAKEFDVSGFVKNLRDGRVVMEAEGEVDQVEAFKAELADRLGVFIRNIESREAVRKPQFRGFTIGH